MIDSAVTGEELQERDARLDSNHDFVKLWVSCEVRILKKLNRLENRIHFTQKPKYCLVKLLLYRSSYMYISISIELERNM